MKQSLMSTESRDISVVCVSPTWKLIFKIASVAILSAINFAVAEDLALGTTLVVSQDAKMRASPPEQKFLIFATEPGAEQAILNVGEKVRVEAVDRLKVPLGEHLWLRVRTDAGRTGWVFYGKDGKSENFTKQSE